MSLIRFNLRADQGDPGPDRPDHARLHSIPLAHCICCVHGGRVLQPSSTLFSPPFNPATVYSISVRRRFILHARRTFPTFLSVRCACRSPLRLPTAAASSSHPHLTHSLPRPRQGTPSFRLLARTHTLRRALRQPSQIFALRRSAGCRPLRPRPVLLPAAPPRRQPLAQ